MITSLLKILMGIQSYLGVCPILNEPDIVYRNIIHGLKYSNKV